MKKSVYEIEREKKFNALTPEHREDLFYFYKAILAFEQDFSEMFDVTAETARTLQNAFYKINNIIPASRKEKNEL